MDGIMLSHETYNRIMQVVDSYNMVAPSFDYGGTSQTDDMRERDLVYMHNTTGSDIPKGTPVKFLEPPNTLHNDWASEFSVDGETATETDEIAGVTIEVIPDQSAGLVKVNGLCIVSGVTIDATTDTHVTIDSGGNLTTAVGGPLVILGTLTAINTFYGGGPADLVCNLASKGSGGGIILGTFTADMDSSDPEGTLTFDADDNPDGYGGPVEGELMALNDLELTANTDDKAWVWTNTSGDLLKIIAIGGTGAKRSNFITGTLNGAITDAGGSVAVTVDESDHDDIDPAQVINAENYCRETADSGARVVVMCSGDTSLNVIVNVECPDP